MKVKLREKKLKYGKNGLYLDYYPPITNPDTQKQTRREHLKLYIYENPKTKNEKEHNKQTLILGENIRSQRQIEIQSNIYGFVSSQHKQKDFLDFFRKLAEAKKTSSNGTHKNWTSTLLHFEAFTHNKCRFADITEGFCYEFKNYLLNNCNLSQNTASIYFTKFKSAVSTASDNNLLQSNPAKRIKQIKIKQAKRSFLSDEEIKKLAITPFEYDDLRRAALFSILTGLRFCDINKLLWSEIQHSNKIGYHISFEQKKTGEFETLPIADEAFQLLGKRGLSEQRVFKNLAYSQCQYLSEWFTAAGITRTLTFHCFRHTYATLQITAGTPLEIISKMLGHRNIKSTQIYAKIIDAKKKEATNKISLK